MAGDNSDTKKIPRKTLHFKITVIFMIKIHKMTDQNDIS